MSTDDDFEKITKICFRGLSKQRSVGNATNPDFKADLYVICVQHEKDPEKWNGTDLHQWSFYFGSPVAAALNATNGYGMR